MSAISTGPPPWPIPPSWAPPPTNPPDPPAERPPAETPETGTPKGAVVVFGADAVGVETRPVPEAADGFELARALARAAGQAAGEGARGVVIAAGAAGIAAPEEAAWALELLYAGEVPLVLAPDHADLPDAVAVAASGLPGLGCVLVRRGEIHAARYASFGSPAAGPLGRVAGESVRLLWRPAGRVTVTAPGEGSPLVGLHTVGLGEDGRALRALAGHCDGLVVAGRVPDHLTPALTELAGRIPVVLAGSGGGSLAATTLDPPKARVLMHLLLQASRDRDAVLAAFAEAENPEGARL